MRREAKLRDLAAVAGLAAAVAFFFTPLLFLKRAPDISDVRSYYYPGWSYFANLMRTGPTHYWCPYIYCGFPLFADSELGPFYPLNRLFWLLPSLDGLIGSLFLHYFLSALFTYAYARYMGLSPLPSLASSLSFSLGGAMIAHLVHPNMVWAAAYLPLFLLLLEMGLRNRSSLPLLGTALVIGLQYLAGFLMIPLMEALIVPVYLGIFVGKEESRGERIKTLSWGASLFILSFLLGTALGSVQNLPSYHLVKESYRSSGLDPQLANVGSLPPLQLLGLVFPKIFGRGIAQGGYVGAWTFEETYCYVGIIPLLLLPFALRRPRDRVPILFAALGLIFLLLSLGNAGFLWPLVRRIPGFHVLKGSSRFILVTCFSLAILGGLGIQRITDRGCTDIGVSSASRIGSMFRSARRTTARFIFATLIAMGLLSIALLHLNPLGFREFFTLIIGPLKGGIPLKPEKLVQELSSFFP